MGQKFCGECGASITSKPPPGSSKRPPSAPPPAREDGAATLVAAEAASIAPALPLLAREDAMAWLEARYHEAERGARGRAHRRRARHGQDAAGARALGRCTLRGGLRGVDRPRVGLGEGRRRGAQDRRSARWRACRRAPIDGHAWDAAYPDARHGLDLLFGVDDGPPSGPGRRHALAEALRWALEVAAERARAGPVVFIVDDLDFIDGTSKNAIEDVLAEPPLVAALLVMTHAPAGGPMGDTLPAETWTLAPLPYAAFADRVPQRLVARGVPLAPLHVEQLIAWSRESADPAPERLVDVIARRAERLPARRAPRAAGAGGLGRRRHPRLALADASARSGRGRPPSTRWTARASSPSTSAASGSRTPSSGASCSRASPPAASRSSSPERPSSGPTRPLEIRAKQAMHGGSALEALSLLDALSVRRAAHGDLSGSVNALRHALDVARRELHRGELDDPVGAVLIFSRKLAEALADEEHWSDAEGVLREALGTAPPASPHRAHLLGVLARVADARQHPDEARRYLDEAMRVARQSDARSLLPILERLDKTNRGRLRGAGARTRAPRSEVPARWPNTYPRWTIVRKPESQLSFSRKWSGLRDQKGPHRSP